ncbi:HNH endonuclease [Paraglaciecola sp. 20A4]|uniref:HNH endonuclease n=1 Tax=Paraglaciecola sp. 20A4 TaxID=2687288 RepID=UPI00140BA2FF|nr:HNH endonuclease [Paraglaciecola sp. 20A4]
MESSSVYFEQQYTAWSSSLGKSEKTIKNYLGALRTTIPRWLMEWGYTIPSFLDIKNAEELSAIMTDTLQHQEFQLRDAKGKGMYSAALRSYRKFLNDIFQVSISQDIDTLLQDKRLNETEKARLIKTRMGQGQFRTELIRYWQGCALTQYHQLEFLIASHIKPWRDSNNQERVDPYNGLLLLANFDKAFDLGYITFKEKGQIVVSEALDDFRRLGIHSEMSIKLTPKHQGFMEYHREQVFIN